jgi:FKBP-type peptidyl-prolyl cis-trans isomerase
VAKNGTRALSLIMAIVFFLSSVGVSLGVILLIRQENEQRKKEEAAFTAPAAQNTEVKGEQTETPADANEEGKAMLQGTKLADFTPVAKIEKLESIDIVPGTGEEVKPGATVKAHYTGAVAADGTIFQSSHDMPGDEPIEFPLSGVIKGWTDGVPGMKVGGKRRLLIPADQAYGATPPPGSGIPANADLVFDIEMTSVQQ